MLAACSSMKPVSVNDLAEQSTPAEIRAGDRVEVITHSSEKFEFNVTQIDARGLSGEFGFIAYDDVRRLRVERPGGSPEVPGWLWGALGVAAAIALIANADSVSVCSPSPCPPPPEE